MGVSRLSAPRCAVWHSLLSVRTVSRLLFSRRLQPSAQRSSFLTPRLFPRSRPYSTHMQMRTSPNPPPRLVCWARLTPCPRYALPAWLPKMLRCQSCCAARGTSLAIAHFPPRDPPIFVQPPRPDAPAPTRHEGNRTHRATLARNVSCHNALLRPASSVRRALLPHRPCSCVPSVLGLSRRRRKGFLCHHDRLRRLDWCGCTEADQSERRRGNRLVVVRAGRSRHP